MKKKIKRKKNPQDTTLRNNRATNKRLIAIQMELATIKLMLKNLIIRID